MVADPETVLLAELAAAALVLASFGVYLLVRYLVTTLRRSTARVLARHRDQVSVLRRTRGVPLEQLAADLRRLRRTVATDQHRSAAHQFGDRLAYDHVLMQLCTMLEIPHELGDLPSGPARDIERFRIEAELERAGIVLNLPSQRAA